MHPVGEMTMPAGFAYREIFLKGKPVHEKYDAFSAKHPKMDAGRRAKIFAPFDALRGFDAALLGAEALACCEKAGEVKA